MLNERAPSHAEAYGTSRARLLDLALSETSGSFVRFVRFSDVFRTNARPRPKPRWPDVCDADRQMEPKTRRDWDGYLAMLAERLIAKLSSKELGIREGVVMSLAGVAPYRRLDCDGRALCYVRCRPQKKVVRVDVSGLWCKPSVSKLALNDTSGSMTLMVKGLEDVDEAVSYLRSVVVATRSLAA